MFKNNNLRYFKKQIWWGLRSWLRSSLTNLTMLGPTLSIKTCSAVWTRWCHRGPRTNAAPTSYFTSKSFQRICLRSSKSTSVPHSPEWHLPPEALRWCHKPEPSTTLHKKMKLSYNSNNNNNRMPKQINSSDPHVNCLSKTQCFKDVTHVTTA